jgi:hypothetical protein
MVSATQKIWEALALLDRTDTHTATLCHAIINMMVRQGVVTREQADRQIEKSMLEVISVHKRIVDAMRSKHPDPGSRPKAKTIH